MEAQRKRAALLPLMGILLLPAFLSGGGEVAEVQELRYWSYPNYTRITVVLNQRVNYTLLELPPDPQRNRGARLAVDLHDCRVPPEKIREYPVRDGLLKQIRIGQFDPQRVRVVLDLERPGDYEVFALLDPFRIVIDFFGSPAPPPPPSPPAPTPPSELPNLLEPHKPKPFHSPPPEQKKTGVPIIVLDPGHGGKDPGAIGHKKLKEKEVVLDIALRVGKLLKKRGAKVIYTRTRDEFLSLEDRTLIANREGADLFVSIHANSARSREAFGVETYFLSTAFDRASRILAASENGMSFEAMGELEELLLSLELTSRKQSSQIFAQWIQKSVLATLNGTASKGGGVRNLGTKGAPFYVLIGSRMPAVLVEVGFITHPREAKRLRDPRYRQRLAEGIARGIWEYWKRSDRVPL